MKGFIFALAKGISPRAILGQGYFGVWQPVPYDRSGKRRPWGRAKWSDEMWETFADYASIKDGDLIFFFQDRRIYGVGRAESHRRASSPVTLNYHESADPSPPDPVSDEAIIGPDSDAEWRYIRLVVRFVPHPHLYPVGVDMDEFLSGPWANEAWGLRFWDGLSFQQLTERETADLRDTFYRRMGNEPSERQAGTINRGVALDRRFRRGIHRSFSPTELVRRTASVTTDPDGRLTREKILHALLVERTANPVETSDTDPTQSPNRLDAYHELAASPPKPPRFGDWIDLVVTDGYGGAEGERRAIRYTVIEVKRASFGSKAKTYDANVPQVMQYVDYVARHYAGGNYAAITAIIVASHFGDELIRRHFDAMEQNSTLVTRSYILDSHESEPTRTWSDLRLVRYEWIGAGLTLTEVRRPAVVS